MSALSHRSLTLALAGALAAPLAAQGSFKSALPADTLMFVTAPDIAKSIEEMQGMPLMKMWHESEVQDFFADSLQMAKEQWDEWMDQGREAHEAGMLPFSPDDLSKLRIEGMSFAITSMGIQVGDGPKAIATLPRFGMAMHADFGASADVWTTVVQTLLELGKQQAGDEIAHRTTDVGGVTLHSISPAKQESPMGLHLAFVGNGMVVGTIESEITDILTSLASGQARLTKQDHYKAAVRSLKTDGAEIEMYMRPGGFFDFMIDALEIAEAEEPMFPQWLDPQGIDRAIDAIGLRGVRGVGSTCNYMGDRCVSSTYVDSPAAIRKGLLSSSAKELDLRFLQWVPKDAVSFSASTLEFASLWDAVESGLKAYDENLAAMVLGRLGEMEKQIGMSVKDDLFGAFGDEVISWSMPMAAFGSAPEIAVLLKVQDQDKLLETMNTMATMTQGTVEIDKVDRRGITVYQVRLDLDLGGGFGGMNPLDMFVPTFGFKDGYMVCGLSTSDVKRVFKRMEREDDASGDIRSNPEFSPYLDKLPKQGLGSVAFTDWKANFEGIYQLVTSMLAFVPLDDDIPFDLSLLPDSSTLTQHLSGSVTWSTGDANGFTSTTVSPFGPETGVLLLGAVAAGAATFAYMSRGF